MHTSPHVPSPALWTDWIREIETALSQAPNPRYRAASEFNLPTPALAEIVVRFRHRLANDEGIRARVAGDRALQALWIQVTNHLKHVSLSFEIEDELYPLPVLFDGAYPLRPTRAALKKTADFLRILAADGWTAVVAEPRDPAREAALLDAQTTWVKDILQNALPRYRSFRARLEAGGPNVLFPEFSPILESLELALRTHEVVVGACRANPHLAVFRAIALDGLAANRDCPYSDTIDAIQRAVEFLDIVHRAADPERSPELFHSDRYEYYANYLKAQTPDHVVLPTIAVLGASDILRIRGVPMGFLGVMTKIEWVDGYHQTPYEFFCHDWNHSRRMYLYARRDALRENLTTLEYARRSDAFMRETILPLIAIDRADSYAEKNRKRAMKILLFEILHEDARAASPESIRRAILLEPLLPAPSERIEDGTKAIYFMEPGASTLAYVFRKIAHDFYDLPENRREQIVSADYRNRDRVVEASAAVLEALGFTADRAFLGRLVRVDLRYTREFVFSITRDIGMRPKDTVPLNDEAQWLA